LVGQLALVAQPAHPSVGNAPASNQTAVVEQQRVVAELGREVGRESGRLSDLKPASLKNVETPLGIARPLDVLRLPGIVLDTKRILAETLDLLGAQLTSVRLGTFARQGANAPGFASNHHLGRGGRPVAQDLV
jgi:hypothetical protein